MIRTVLGDVPASQLGHTQCHEHLFIEKGKSYEINDALLMDDAALSLRELLDYGNAGGNTIVDAQPAFCGRMADKLEYVSEMSGINIIAVTGFHKLCFYPENSFILTADESELCLFFMDEIRNGMVCSDGSVISAKAGLIKAALDIEGMQTDARYEKLFAAAARAAVRTGVGILVHTEKNADALGLINYFGDFGIAANRLIICHLDRMRYDLQYHKEVARTGAYLCYDSINRLKYLSHKQELDLLCDMIEAGLENRILLSLDTTRSRLRAYGAEFGLDYILNNFIPMLKERGVSDSVIISMTRDNAKSALELRKEGEVVF